jgi:hypothetical protein
MERKLAKLVQCWLLNSNIQILEGKEAGGVAGWLDSDGIPEFVYSEIVGYYLTCLAFMTVVTPSLKKWVCPRAQRAIDWLFRECNHTGTPPTRRYLTEERHDWRNRVIFAFDLAMVLRGVVAVRGLVEETSRIHIQESILRTLVRFCNPEGSLFPCIARGDNGPPVLPPRWSTRPGPYQLKIALALRMSLAASLPQELKLAVESLCFKWQIVSPELALTGEWHADLYFIEGLVLLAMQGNDERIWLATVLNLQLLVDRVTHCKQGSTLASFHAFAERSDTVAQTLRLASILLSQGYLRNSRWRELLQDLAFRLRGFIQRDGAVVWLNNPEKAVRHFNAWSAMFTYQALIFYDKVAKKGLLPSRWAALLI